LAVVAPAAGLRLEAELVEEEAAAELLKIAYP